MALPDREPIRNNEPLSAPARAIFADRVIHAVLNSVQSTPAAMEAVFEAWKRPNFVTDFAHLHELQFALNGTEYTLSNRVVERPELGAHEGLAGVRRHITLKSTAEVDGVVRETVLSANCEYTGDAHDTDPTRNVKRFIDGDVTLLVVEDGVINTDLGFDIKNVRQDPADAGSHLYDTEVAMHFQDFLR